MKYTQMFLSFPVAWDGGGGRESGKRKGKGGKGEGEGGRGSEKRKVKGRRGNGKEEGRGREEKGRRERGGKRKGEGRGEGREREKGEGREREKGEGREEKGRRERGGKRKEEGEGKRKGRWRKKGTGMGKGRGQNHVTGVFSHTQTVEEAGKFFQRRMDHVTKNLETLQKGLMEKCKMREGTYLIQVKAVQQLFLLAGTLPLISTEQEKLV